MKGLVGSYPSPFQSFRKYFAQFNKAAIQNIDLCHTLPIIDLMEL